MPIDPNSPTSDIGMMYRQYLQSKGAPLNNSNLQQVIAQSQREPGMIAGLTASPSANPAMPGIAEAPPNIAGASPSSSGGAMPMPKASPTGIPQSMPIPPIPPGQAQSSMPTPPIPPQGGPPPQAPPITEHSSIQDALGMLGLGAGSSIGALLARASSMGGAAAAATPPPGQPPLPAQSGGRGITSMGQQPMPVDPRLSADIMNPPHSQPMPKPMTPDEPIGNPFSQPEKLDMSKVPMQPPTNQEPLNMDKILHQPPTNQEPVDMSKVPQQPVNAQEKLKMGKTPRYTPNKLGPAVRW